MNTDDRPMSPILILTDLPPVSPPSETDDFDSFSIESELLEQRLKAINYAEIIINRDSLFNDTINQFKSLGLTRIYVKFDGEPGDDFEGLTRELISEFWKEFCEKLSGGEKLLYLNPTAMSYPKEEDLVVVGKILMIGFILTGFLPTQFNNSFLFFVLTGKRLKGSLESFLSCFSNETNELFRNCLAGTNGFGIDAKLAISRVLSYFELSSLPTTPSELQTVLESLATFILYVKPHHMLEFIRKGALSITSKFEQCSDKDFLSYIEKQKPKGSDIVKILNPSYSENPNYRFAEETVVTFLEDFLEDLNHEDASTFMKYVSGCEMMRGSVRVEFNSETNVELMVPKAGTCGVSISISRFFLNQNQFSGIMSNLLANPSLWARFDSV